LIFLHNHPVADEASFSSDDLAKLAWYDAACGVVVSKSEVYVIFPKRERLNRWPSPEVFKPYMDQHVDLLHSIPSRGADGQPCQLVTATNELLAQLATDYDLDYYHWSKGEVNNAEVAAAILGK